MKPLSLGKCKQLQARGFSQNTHFYYLENPRPKSERTDTENNEVLLCKDQRMRLDGPLCFSAPIVEDLLDMLPPYVKLNSNIHTYLRIDLMPSDRRFRVQYMRATDQGQYPADRFPINPIMNTSLGEALADMWLWLESEGRL